MPQMETPTFVKAGAPATILVGNAEDRSIQRANDSSNRHREQPGPIIALHWYGRAVQAVAA